MTHLTAQSTSDRGAPAPIRRPRSPQAPIRAWTRSALRDVLYTAAVAAWSVIAFTILVTGIAITTSLLVLVVGVFVWFGFAYVLRWTTWVDRRLAGWQRGEDVPAVHRRPTSRGFPAALTTLSRDPQTWKDLAWLAVTSVLGFTTGVAVAAASGLAMTYVSMPLWYWAVEDPHAHDGITDLGLSTLDTLGEAGVMAAIGFALIPLVLCFARCCAALHAGLAVRLLGPRR